MRVFAWDRAFCRKIRVDADDHPETRRRFDLLRRVGHARRTHEMTVAAALDVAGLVRST